MERPNTIFYQRGDEANESESFLTKISIVKEYWNLDKSYLFRQLQEFYAMSEPKKQREKINKVMQKISEETTINFLNSSADRIGNIEIFIPSKLQENFECNVNRIFDSKSKEVKARGIEVLKKNEIDYDLLINCCLYNAKRCLINEVKKMKSTDRKIDFIAEEVISEIEVSIWNEKTGKLVYREHSSLCRQLKLSMKLMNNTQYLINDEWTTKLKKTFGGSNEKEQKLKKVKNINRENKPKISNIGDFKDDPWNEAGKFARRLIKQYCIESPKGAFCKKVGEGECEIDSFQKIIQLINESRVKKVIIVDPYFSVMAIQKFLPRITNLDVKVEVLTSLSNINPDKDENEAMDKDYLNKVRKFLENNSQVIHQYMRIINITRNAKTAIHDRYLVRLLDDETIDGYLLSNSLNSAGQNYSFVIAPMDKEVTYQVLEYINEIKDDDLQRQKSKTERLDIEILWDTYEKKYEKPNHTLVPVKKWESRMKNSYEKQEIIEIGIFFCEGWDKSIESAKESILKLCWYLYNTSNYTASECAEWIVNNNISRSYVIRICDEAATELEKEEELYEETDINNHSSESKMFRIALSNESQNQVQIYPQHLMNQFVHFFYGINGYLGSVYELIYELNKKEIISVMQKNHSPKALEFVIEKMSSERNFEYEMYTEMNNSEITWIRQWSYYYLAWYVIRKYVKGEKIEEYIEEYVYENKNIGIYQYACCIEEIAFEVHCIEESNRGNQTTISVLKEALNNCIVNEVEMLENTTDFEYDEIFHLLDGPNEALNCKNYLQMVQLMKKDDVEKKFLLRMITLLKDKWKISKQFNENSDYNVTYNAAYASLIYWDNNVEKIFVELNIDSKSLFCACEPGRYDMHYNEWNNDVQKVLWQLLFLKFYKEILQLHNVQDDDSYNLIIKKIDVLSAIKEQSDKGDDYANLRSSIFDKENLLQATEL